MIDAESIVRIDACHNINGEVVVSGTVLILGVGAAAGVVGVKGWVVCLCPHACGVAG